MPEMGMLEAITLSVIAASTPLLLAAAGELVVERSGVLNLGVEGMMILGAAVGFAAASTLSTPLGTISLLSLSVQIGPFNPIASTILGTMWGIFAGIALSALFALLTIGFAANQVASGLATTALG